MNMLHLLLRILEKIIKKSKNLFVSKDRIILRQRRLNLFKPTLPYFNINFPKPLLNYLPYFPIY